MLFIAYVEVTAQFVLSRSFKQRFANASLSQLAIGYVLRLQTASSTPYVVHTFSHFFATQLLMYYDIAA